MIDSTPLLNAIATPRPGVTRARSWSLYAIERRRLSLGTKDRQTGNAHTPLTLSESAGVRYLLVWEDDLVSRGYLERRQVERDVDGALTQARASAYEDEDAAQVLGPATFPEVQLHDAEVASLVTGDTPALENRLRTVRRTADDSGFRTWSGSFSAVEGRVRLLTSEGLDVRGEGTTVSWHVTFEGEWGDGYGARAMEDDARYEARVERLADTVRRLKTPAPNAVGGVRPVLLHPHVVEQFVLETLLHNLDGSHVAHGESAYGKSQFASGERVLREDLSLRLDPLRPLRRGSYRFSPEGVPAASCAFVERGRLITPILNLKYAKRLRLPPTPIPYGMDTLFLEASEEISLSEAFDLADGGALVLTVLGVHTLDPSSGEFSLASPQALRIASGGPDGRIRATLSGNLFDLLRSDDLRLVRFEDEHTPGLLCTCRIDPVPDPVPGTTV